MTYITIRQKQKPFQLSFEDVLFERVTANKLTGKSDKTGTITRVTNEELPAKVLEKVDVSTMVNWLKEFNIRNKELHNTDKETLYTHFCIPKKTGGWRNIDAPKPELQNALASLVDFFTNTCGMLYHTAAFAYVEDRSIVDAVKKHAYFKSNWFLKTDISGFFPNTTLEFTMRMLSMIFPLSEVVKTEEGKKELEKAISLGFLHGGLPQGTVLSPTLTNLLFLPIDHKLFNEFAHRNMVYTRYADDMHISAKQNFSYKKMVKIIEDSFREFDAPYVIKDEKTHYGSVGGANWLLGLICNKEHKITVGWRNKKYFKAELCNFVLDTKNGKPWDLDEVQSFNGRLSYYKMIEKKYFTDLIERANKKWNVNVEGMIKSYMKIA